MRPDHGAIDHLQHEPCQADRLRVMEVDGDGLDGLAER